MKVLSKQRNSRMCIICGLDNELGVKAPFYNMEDGSVVSLFRFLPEHQSYPGRVHGGLIAAMLDELGLRALWAADNAAFAVTTSLETKYRKPVPYSEPLKGRAYIISNSPMFVKSRAEIYDMKGNLLANADLKYIKLPADKITDADTHEEMPYLIEDGIIEI